MDIKNKLTNKLFSEYEDVLYKDVVVWADSSGVADVKIPYKNVSDSNKFLVKSLYWITDEELNELDPNEYLKMVKEATEKLPKGL